MGNCGHTLISIKKKEIYTMAREQFLPLKIKGDPNFVYIDIKNHKVIPKLQPLKKNALYAKRKGS